MTSTGTIAEPPRVTNTRWRLGDGGLRTVVFDVVRADFRVVVDVAGECAMVVVTWPRGPRAVLRAVHAPGGSLAVSTVSVAESSVALTLEAACGRFDVTVDVADDEEPIIRCQTRLTPAIDMTVTDWPRDLTILGPAGSATPAAGTVDIAGSGLNASLLQLSLEGCGSLFYFQNLTSVAPYADTTKVSLSGTVGGEWPEVGFQLPASSPGTYLAAGESVVIADTFLRPSPRCPSSHLECARQFLTNLGSVYVHVPRPDLTFRDWRSAADAVLQDLETCVGCWSFAAGRKYVNAYLSDGRTPPELMVQLAVLMPLLDFARSAGVVSPSIGAVRSTLESFFDPQLGTVRRWLPARDDHLDGAEEQKRPNVMDSWYLHHTMLNLGRLASRGDDGARDLFFGSLEYVIAVARRYKYDWPIFFNIENLDVVRAEATPGSGGEKDVPGIYAHVMVQAWELSGEQRYLEEAKRAGRALASRGFAIFYQANVTAFGAVAMFRLWKITGSKRFLDACYLCVANVFANMWLWDCHYGYGRHYRTFLASLPVKDAPYIASYEEQEVGAAFATLLSESADDDVLPAMTLLLSEYVRHVPERAWFAYPCNVPADQLPDRPKTGELCGELWIPLEDVRDGWEKSGSVGQEVYGAALALGVVTRHFHPVRDGQWTLFAESLIAGPTMEGCCGLSFTVLGDPRVPSRVRILGDGRPRRLRATTDHGGRDDVLVPAPTQDGDIEYVVHGGETVTLAWGGREPSAVDSPARGPGGPRRRPQ